MGDEPGLTPEQRLFAAIERTVEMTGKWMEDTWDAVRPILRRLEKLATDPQVQARVRWRAEEDGSMIRPACQCVCEKVHADAWVCDVKAVTSVRHYSDPSGPVDVPVCAPCAAEVIARQQ
jgi:hypothetical protein